MLLLNPQTFDPSYKAKVDSHVDTWSVSVSSPSWMESLPSLINLSRPFTMADTAESDTISVESAVAFSNLSRAFESSY